jgi:hypothetical protein
MTRPTTVDAVSDSTWDTSTDVLSDDIRWRTYAVGVQGFRPKEKRRWIRSPSTK